MRTAVFKVVGLDCAEEVGLLKKALASAPGVDQLTFNILQSQMTVTYDPQLTNPEKLTCAVAQTGMQALPWKEAVQQEKEPFWRAHGRFILTTASALFLIAGIAARTVPWWYEGFYLASILCGVWYVLPKAWYALRRFSPDMNLLMVIAICGAIAIREWFEGATVAFLFSLSLLLEQWSVGRARKAVAALMDLAPTKARLITGERGDLVEVPVAEVAVGSHILVRPGEKIPLDATVIQGSSAVDQSPITGESMPVTKQEGDEVFAGTLNGEGAMICRVTKVVGETTLARITHLVEEARSKRSASEQWIEIFARYYTPIMLVFALLVMFLPPLLLAAPWVTWIYRGLVLLVIACPCALVISTPVSIVCGLTAAAKGGVLVKGGEYLEEVGKLKALAMDKTGTLTHGHPAVQAIVPLNGHTVEELMERAVALEQSSEHPLARAILRKGEEMGVRPERASNYQAIKGKGALATYKGKMYWIGSHRFMHEMGQETAEIHDKALALEDAGHSIIALGNDDHVCGLISVADSPRQEVRAILRDIKSQGIEEIVMLTGDNVPTAQALASHAGVDRFYAELLPDEKVEKILELAHAWEKVGMVGDGVNDAPALAAASVGIAMGGIGAPAAVETADVALMSDDLAKLPWLIKHSKRVLQIIKQNITFALGVKALFILLALLNEATLWMAIAADTGATLLVITNALRLLRIRK